jgi:hypothetical protein
MGFRGFESLADAVFKINDADNGSDELEIMTRGNGLTVTVEEPWAGDTETGFGRACTIRISKEQGRELAEWLLAHS